MSSAGNSISSQPLNYCFVILTFIQWKVHWPWGLFCWVFPCLQHFLLSGVSRQCSSTNSHETVGDSLERSSLLSKITHPKNWSNLKPDFFFQIWNLLFLGPCFSDFSSHSTSAVAISLQVSTVWPQHATSPCPWPWPTKRGRGTWGWNGGSNNGSARMWRMSVSPCFAGNVVHVFSHRKSDLLAIFFLDSCFFQRYVFSTFHHRYVCNTEKVWVQVFHSSGSFFLRLGGFTCPNAVGCCYWRTMSRWPSLWAFILHTFLDLLMQKMLIGSFDSDELDPNVCCYGNCRDNWAIFVVRFLADRVRATGLPHCNPAGSFSNPYPQHSSGFPFLAA